MLWKDTKNNDSPKAISTSADIKIAFRKLCTECLPGGDRRGESGEAARRRGGEAGPGPRRGGEAAKK